MQTQPEFGTRPLPDRPDLRHLRQQAKELLKAGQAASLADAQFRIARSYGFPSWPRLKSHVESFREIGQLKAAIDANDIDRVIGMMTRNRALHAAPLGYGKSGPLTWAAECRVPWEAPGPTRLAMAKWMIEHGSDVHQGGDGPLMRAALVDERIPMMELLVSHGADVNALWGGYFPIIFAPCETLAPSALKWLLDRAAAPNCADAARGVSRTALDYVIATYSRSPRLAACIDILRAAGGVTKYDLPAVLEVMCGRTDRLAWQLDAAPFLVHHRFPQLDFGATARRRLTLKGATLLHVAAEYGNVEAAALLLDRGADVNAPADADESGVGGQTPIFHAVTQFDDFGVDVARLLIDRGADLSIQVRIPGHYERLDEIVEATPLQYGMLFPGDEAESGTLELLRAGRRS